MKWIRFYIQDDKKIRKFLSAVKEFCGRRKTYFHILGPYKKDKVYWDFRIKANDDLFKEIIDIANKNFTDEEWTIIEANFRKNYQEGREWTNDEVNFLIKYLHDLTLLWITGKRENIIKVAWEVTHLYNFLYRIDDCDSATSYFWVWFYPKSKGLFNKILVLISKVDRFVRKRLRIFVWCLLKNKEEE